MSGSGALKSANQIEEDENSFQKLLEIQDLLIRIDRNLESIVNILNEIVG